MTSQDIQAINSLLEDILQELKKSTLPQRLWDSADVGAYMGVKRSTALAHICNQPWFPKAQKIPGVGRRWVPQEVMDAIRIHGNGGKTRGRPRRTAA